MDNEATTASPAHDGRHVLAGSQRTDHPAEETTDQNRASVMQNRGIRPTDAIGSRLPTPRPAPARQWSRPTCGVSPLIGRSATICSHPHSDQHWPQLPPPADTTDVREDVADQRDAARTGRGWLCLLSHHPGSRLRALPTMWTIRGRIRTAFSQFTGQMCQSRPYADVRHHDPMGLPKGQTPRAPRRAPSTLATKYAAGNPTIEVTQQPRHQDGLRCQPCPPEATPSEREALARAPGHPLSAAKVDADRRHRWDDY
jgi:hypothetical protein